MSREPFVDGFEALCLTAVHRLGRNAYGMTIHEEVEGMADGKRPASIGSVYITLDRLEEKGYVKSWFSDPTAARGGRSKRYFELTGIGQLALDNARRVSANMLGALGGMA